MPSKRKGAAQEQRVPVVGTVQEQRVPVVGTVQEQCVPVVGTAAIPQASKCAVRNISCVMGEQMQLPSHGMQWRWKRESKMLKKGVIMRQVWQATSPTRRHFTLPCLWLELLLVWLALRRQLEQATKQNIGITNTGSVLFY